MTLLNANRSKFIFLFNAKENDCAESLTSQRSNATPSAISTGPPGVFG
jgi:hypothetical protein